MANYTQTFTKPYPSGWVDKPSKTTPATAAIMNSYDTAIAALEAYLRDNAIKNVSANTTVKSGTKIATITIDGTEYVLYSPNVSYESAITGGTKVGTITVGANTFDVYAPTSSTGGSTVSVVPKTLTGTNIAEITVDDTTYQLYAPTSGGGSGSTVTAEATLTEGTQIGKITIDGVETILYAPTASPITVDSELSATSENAIQNKAVDAAVKNLQQQIDAGGAGGSVTVDSALSTTSVNPVQNKVVTAEFNKKIETLDDESQAPDVVNFDLDSELSLTSVKGVQNKVIAEEFQKYANGTKVVAKATEANTATTASNAEKVNGHTVGTDVPSNAVFTDTVYDDSAVKASIQNIVNGTTQVGSATKATQDAQGNVINETYAKKTEVPQGTVVDDALSSTSTNPVQNKVVKAEFDQVNSNLTQQSTEAMDLKMLGWSVPSECPVQNYVDSDGVYHQIVGRVDLGSLDFELSASVSWGHPYFQHPLPLNDAKIPNSNSDSFNGYCYKYKTTSWNGMGAGDDKSVCIITSGHLRIKDTTYTDATTLKHAMNGVYLYYELEEEKTINVDGNEAVTQINESLSVIGKCKNLLNPTLATTTVNGITCTNNGDGTITLNGTASASANATFRVSQLEIQKYLGKTLRLVGCPKNGSETTYHIFFTDNQNSNSSLTDLGEGATKIVEQWGSSEYWVCYITIVSGVTVSNLVFKPMITEDLIATYDDFVPYTGEGDTLAEDVAELKNDLSDLKDGTTPVAKAVADEDGNNIKSTYAKKTEVPSGSIVDSIIGLPSNEPNLWTGQTSYDFSDITTTVFHSASAFFYSNGDNAKENPYIGMGNYTLSFDFDTTVSTLDSALLNIKCYFVNSEKDVLSVDVSMGKSEKGTKNIDLVFSESVKDITIKTLGGFTISNMKLIEKTNIYKKIDYLRKIISDLGK